MTDPLCVLLISDHPSRMHEELEQALRAAGPVGGEHPSLVTTAECSSPPALVLSLAVQSSGRSSYHARAADAAARWRASWIAVNQIGSRFLLVASMPRADVMPCYSCATACVDAWLHDAVRGTAATGSMTAAQIGFAAAVVSEAALDVLAKQRRGTAAELETSVVLYDFAELSSVELPLGRIPDCPVCWPSTSAPTMHGPALSLPALFEECARARNRLENGRLPARLRNDSQTAQARFYPHSARVPLPAWSALHRTRHERTNKKLDLEKLAAVLFLTFGRWNGMEARRPDRVLPSAGNLGSPGAFVVNRSVAGLEPGVYAYLEESHALARIGDASTAVVDEMLSGLDGNGSQTALDAVLVIAGAYTRIGVKYGAFAYRLVHFDAGLFTAHLRAVAESLSLAVSEIDQWPDRMLARQLALRPYDSPIVATIGLSARDSDVEFAARPIEEVAPKQTAVPPLHHTACTANVLARRMQQMSRKEALSGWACAVVESRIRSSAGARADPSISRLHAELWDELLTRQSVRAFEDKPIALPVVEAVLRDAKRSVRLRASAPTIKVLATIRTGSLREPLWRTYELSGEGGIVPYGVPAFHGTLDTIFVHPPPARAPVVFWLCGDVRQTAWGYRRMLFEAGQHSYALTGQAASFGLQGVLVGGVWPRRAASLLGLRFCDESPLLAFACGRPQPGFRGD